MPPPARRLRTGRVNVAAAVAVTVLSGLLAGCTEDAAPPPPAPPTTVPLEDIDLTGATVVRSPFCDRLDEESLAAVLGGEPRRTDAWESGDRRRVGATRDVVHEAGCSYRRAGFEASAWVFAQPVTRRDARTPLKQLRAVKGCSPAGELDFGRPGEVVLCRQPQGRLVRMAGLFGDAWLTCEVRSAGRAAADEALERAQRWCVDVVYAAGPG